MARQPGLERLAPTREDETTMDYRSIRLAFCLAAVAGIVALGGLACAPAEPAFEPEIPDIPDLPLGLDANMMQIPDDNPITAEKVALGWQLFYDPRLSLDGTISCASCHQPEHAFGDPEQFSTGVDKKFGNRNAMPIINSAFHQTQFWDGRTPTLEEQALGPVANPVEMANRLDNLIATLNTIPGYRQQFLAVFGSEEITEENVGKAIATFERVMQSGNSAWDQYVAGDREAVSEAAIRGHELHMGKAGCSQCHVGVNFTDAPFGLYHNIGVGMDAEEPDLGRFVVTGEEADKGAFKTPTLRDVVLTAPYMHDGSQETLEEVIFFYIQGGHPNDWLDPKISPLDLSDEEVADLLAFLETLTGEVPEWSKRAPALPPSPAEE
jgi:cytochrome c peroxidase